MFKAKRKDGRPIWRLIYDEVVKRIDSDDLKVGQVTNHSELRPLLELDEQKFYYGAVRTASQHLERSHKRSLKSWKGVGYELSGGMTQVEQGQAKQKSAGRTLTRALDLVQHSDRGLMDAGSRTQADHIQKCLVRQGMVLAMTVEEVLIHTKQIEELRTAQMKSSLQQTATAEELAELRKRIDGIQAQV